jgi:hypothetical protein
MAVVNDRFRVARQRTASLAYPDECLSRRELAELVNAYVWEGHRRVVALDANYVGEIKRGLVRWPGRLYRVGSTGKPSGRSWVPPPIPRWGSSIPVAR